MNYGAILFDLDGTLVDSIEWWGKATIAACAEKGIPIAMETFREWYKKEYLLKEWLRTKGYPQADIDRIRARRDEYYMQSLRTNVAWFDGAEELLRSLSGTLPLALITNSHRRYLDAICEKLPLAQYFTTIVTEDEMGGFRKPHPHGFFLVTDALGVAPRDCFSVGDRLLDVETAHAAGMPCCIVKGTYTNEEAITTADFVVDSLAKMTSILGDGSH